MWHTANPMKVGVILAKLVAAGMLLWALAGVPPTCGALGWAPTHCARRRPRVRLLCSAAVGCLWRRGSRCVSGGGIRQEGLGLGAGHRRLFFNPIIPVHLTRDTWGFIDVGVALLLLVSIALVDLRPPSPRPRDREPTGPGQGDGNRVE